MMTPDRPSADGCSGVFCWEPQRQERDITLRILLLVIFGSAGTLARYALQGLVQYRTESSFPTGTLAVNLTGCFLLGGIGQFALERVVIPPDWRVAITVGFFGAFTTFSSFGWETVQMLQDGEWMRAILYVSLSLVGGLLLVFAGIRIAERI
jgi:fluoride exporter